MAIEILGELIAGAFEVGISTAVEGKIMRWRRSSFFEQAARVDQFGELDAARQRAFLEVAMAAVLDDGQLSEAEKTWLDARRGTAKESEAIDAAIEATTAALGSPVSRDKLAAFVRERAAILDHEETRGAALAVAGVVLQDAGRTDYADVVRAFGTALGLPEKEIVRVIEMVQGGPPKA